MDVSSQETVVTVGGSQENKLGLSPPSPLQDTRELVEDSDV